MARKKLSPAAIALRVEEKIGVKPTLTKNVVKAIGEIAAEELLAGNDFAMPGIATVKLAYRPKKGKRLVRNPQTGETSMADPKPAMIAVRAIPNAAMKRAAPSPTTKAGRVVADEYKSKRGLA